MSTVRLTQGELKIQRDRLQAYQRFLPTLQLKKQQLHLELNKQSRALESCRLQLDKLAGDIIPWMGLLAESGIVMGDTLDTREVFFTSRNVAGVDIPVFDHLEFQVPDYDLFATPLWLDRGIMLFREYIDSYFQLEALKKGEELLRRELLTTTQRVNLFEKVKIPEAQEHIRLIRIHIGDQLAGSIGRSKLVKRRTARPVREAAR
ncbi:MAG: V-type ATP synthase subunit D [Syntrophales bacterium]|jgi:V/A-type H+-transporting ATPase subunit D|nr:V-type ATP synthase subunit D [Syntrophales bacterium]